MPSQNKDLPEPEKVDAVDKYDPKVQSAVKFLTTPNIRPCPAENKIAFLREKGLSVAQIKCAFDLAGQPISLESVEAASVRASRMASTPGSGTAGTPMADPSPSPLSTHPSPNHLPPYRTQTLYPAPSTHQAFLAPLSSGTAAHEKGVDWRDVVIGVGGAVLAGVAGVKLFQRYSPYEIRRKGEGGGRSRPRAGLRAGGSCEGAHADGELPAGAPTLPLPPVPNGPEWTAGAAPPRLPPPSPDTDAAIARLETELQDAKEALAGERKRSAELSITVAKLRAGKQELANMNDRLSQKVEELEGAIQKLEQEAKEKQKAQGEEAQEEKKEEQESKEDGATGQEEGEGEGEGEEGVETTKEATAEGEEDGEGENGQVDANVSDEPTSPQVTEAAAPQEGASARPSAEGSSSAPTGEREGNTDKLPSTEVKPLPTKKTHNGRRI